MKPNKKELFNLLEKIKNKWITNLLAISALLLIVILILNPSSNRSFQLFSFIGILLILNGIIILFESITLKKFTLGMYAPNLFKGKKSTVIGTLIFVILSLTGLVFITLNRNLLWPIAISIIIAIVYDTMATSI